MDNVSLCGSCLTGRRVNRNEGYILPYKPQSSGLSLSCYHCRKTEVLIFSPLELKSVLASVKSATFSLIQRPNGAIKIFFSFFMDSETPVRVNILKFYIYIYLPIYIYIKDHSM